MNEKKPGVSESEYVTAKINSGASFEMILSFDFCTISKILICFSLMKHFPNNHKRYSYHLQVLILHRAAPIKVYVTIYENLENSYLKTFSYHKETYLANFNPRAALYEDSSPGVEVGLQQL